MSVLLLLLPYTVLAEDWTDNEWHPVSNFSFEVLSESGPCPFDSWDFTGSDGEIEPCLAYSLHYTSSAHIIVNQQKDAYLEQMIDNQPGLDFGNQPCYLIAFVKTKGVSSTGTGGIEARVITDTDNPPVHKEYSSNIIVDDHNWSKLIVPFDSVALDGFGDAITIRIGLFEAEGEAWIDSVQLISRDVLISQDTAQIPNIKNPSFESYSNNNFDNWLKLTPIGVTITADADNLVLGSKSAKFDFGNGVINRTASLTQSLTLPLQYRTYAFSGFIRTENLQTSGIPSALGAYCQVSYGGITWNSQSYNLSNGWTKIQGVFEKPKGTSSSLSVKALVSAKSGKAWFDWLTLRLNYVQNVEFNNWETTPPPDLAVWKKENISGNGTAEIDLTHGHISNPCGKIHNNYDTDDTVLSQMLGLLKADSSIDEMHLHEGGTYRLTGWIKTEDVTPSPIHGQPDIAPNGAFVELWAVPPTPPDGTVLLVRSECLINDSNWNQFSLVFSIPLDFFADEHDDIDTFFTAYYLRCRLHAASGTAYFDDVNIVELEPTEDLATVVPQPQAVEYRGNESDPLVIFQEGDGLLPLNIVTIYYTQGVDPSNPPQSDPYWFSADYLRQEINRAFYQCGDSGDEDNLYPYPIESGDIVCLNSSLSATQLLKPCIVIGDPTRDLSQHHLFQNELAKRGVVFPQNFNPEGYLMEISEDVILIAASDYDAEGVTEGSGSYYGMQTLLQTLEITAESQTLIEEDGIIYRANTVQAPALYAYDYPDLPWRGEWYMDIPWDNETGGDPGEVLTYKFDPDNTDGEQYFQQNERDIAFFSALKANKMYIETGVYYYQATIRGGTADNYDEYWQRMEDLFAYCRQHHIEPIPILQSGGHSAHILYWHPEFAECMWIGGVSAQPGGTGDPYPRVREERQFPQNNEIDLTVPNVFDYQIFNKPTDWLSIKVYDAQGNLYERGTDKDWYITFNKTPFFSLNDTYVGPEYQGGFDRNSSTAPTVTIHRTEDGDIPFQGTVYISYNAIWPEQDENIWGVPYCSGEDGLYDFMENVIDTTIDRLNPQYIHLGHDEVMQYHTDERDRDQDFEESLLGDEDDYDMPSRLLATDTDKLIDIVKDRPNPPQVILWGDLFNQKLRGEFFCSVEPKDAPGHFQYKARPCDMGGVDDWSDGSPRGKTWQACDLLKDEGHQDALMNGWTSKTWKIDNPPGPPIYASDFIGEALDWQLAEDFAALGCTYNGIAGEATANLVVDYVLDGVDYHQEVKFEPMIFDKDSWFCQNETPYITAELSIPPNSTINPDKDPYVSARISDYLCGSVWFDQLRLYATDNPSNNLLENPGFETAGNGDDDVFASWDENPNDLNHDDQVIRDTQIKFYGNASCQLYRTHSLPPEYKHNFVVQNVEGDIQPGKTYVLEGYMRGQKIESFILENNYSWSHQVYERYCQHRDCTGINLYDYTFNYPAAIMDWLWSINYPHRWWVHDALMPYLKIGHTGASPGTDYYPLNNLYPVEPSKGEE